MTRGSHLNTCPLFFAGMETNLTNLTQDDRPRRTAETANLLQLNSQLHAISDDGLYHVEFSYGQFHVWMPSAPKLQRNGSFDYSEFTLLYAKTRWHLMINPS